MFHNLWINPETLDQTFLFSTLNTLVKFTPIYLESEGVAGDAILHQTVLGIIQICQLGADADDEYHTIQQLSRK